MLRSLSLAGTVLALWSTPPTDVAAQCVGDCHGSGSVGVNELATGVGIALDRDLVTRCPAFDSIVQRSLTTPTAAVCAERVEKVGARRSQLAARYTPRRRENATRSGLRHGIE